MSDPKTSRGYRNRNPGNIEYNVANRWQGQVGIEPGGRFATFETHVWGIRAMAVLLIAYQDRHGLRTVQRIVSRWAPAADGNAVAAYVGHVCEIMGRAKDAALDLHTHADLEPLVRAIITHELGGQPYDQPTLDEALRLAGVPRPVETLADAAHTGTGRAAVNVAAVASAAAAAAPAVSALGDVSPWVAAALVAGVVALAALWIISGRVRA